MYSKLSYEPNFFHTNFAALIRPLQLNCLAFQIEFFTIRPNCTFLAHIYIRQVTMVDPFNLI